MTDSVAVSVKTARFAAADSPRSIISLRATKRAGSMKSGSVRCARPYLRLALHTCSLPTEPTTTGSISTSTRFGGGDPRRACVAATYYR